MIEQSTKRIVIAGLAVVAAAGTGYLWWSQPAHNGGSAEITPAGVERSAANEHVPVSPANETTADAPVRPRPAGTDANSAPPSPAAMTDAVATLTAQLGDFRDPDARRASRSLVALGPSAALDVVAGLRAVTRDTRAARSNGTAQSDLDRLAVRKMQLIVVLGEIGGPEHADALVEAARASAPNSLAHQNVAIALGRMGALDEARSYARDTLANSDLQVVQARALLGQLIHFPSAQDQDIARTYMAGSAPALLRDLGLLLGARSGLGAEVATLAPSVVTQATRSERDFYTLLALAEAMPPADFERAVAGTPLGQSRASRAYFDQALAHSRFHWADDATKENLLRQQLTADQGELVIAGLKFVLDSGRTDWLLDLGIVQNVREARRAAGLPADGDVTLKVAPHFARYMGFTGYRIDVSADVPRIRKL